MKDNYRKAYNAGTWYPGSAAELQKTLAKFITPAPPRQPAYGLLAPHAGYIYSGATAGKTYARVAITPTVVVVTSSHIPAPTKYSIWDSGAWETPLGDIPVDSSLATKIREFFPELSCDKQAHLPQVTWRGKVADHSLEIQLPFLKYLNAEVKLVPIALVADNLHYLEKSGNPLAESAAAQAELADLKRLGQALAKAIIASGSPTLIVASSDMNHFASEQETEKRDRLALEQVLNLNPDGVYRVCGENAISMCGAAAAVVMLTAAKAQGATKAELIEHTTSAAVTADYSNVVGYAGVVVR